MLVIAGKQQAPFPGIELPSTAVNLTYIWLWNDSSSNSFSICACDKRVCVASCKNTVWSSTFEMHYVFKTTPISFFKKLPKMSFGCSLLLCYLHGKHLCMIPDCLFYKMAKTPLGFCAQSFFKKKFINLSWTMPNISFVFNLEYLDSSCQSTHGAPIWNLFL